MASSPCYDRCSNATVHSELPDLWLSLCRHVVFGNVVDGMDVVKKMEETGSNQGHPSERVIIEDCGELKE